jgi:hypothetical protein
MLTAKSITGRAGSMAITAAATLLVLIPLLYNGTPLYYPDSMGYIFWGQMWDPVPERVSSYAAFIRVAAMGRDLWIPILIQGLCTVLVLIRLWKLLTGEKPSSGFLFIVFLLGLLSPLGWTASTLMPDIFCVLSSIYLYFIIFPEKGQRFSVADLLLFSLCTSQHLSAVIINLALLLIICAWLLLKKGPVRLLKAAIPAFTGIGMALLITGLIHWSMSRQFFISRSGPAFLTARLAETGGATRYLGRNPQSFPEFQSLHYRFPMPAEHFLWKPDSPIKELGGINDDKGLMRKFTRSVLTDPSSLFLFFKAGIKSGMKQFFLLDVGDGLIAADCLQLTFYLENQAEYINARQHFGIDFEKFNNFSFIFWCVPVLIFILTGSVSRLSPESKHLGVFIIIMLIINALVNGTLSTPLNRYQVRVFWLVYFWLLAALYPTVKNLSSYFRNQHT